MARDATMSGPRDVPARCVSECNQRLRGSSSAFMLSKPLRPGTGRAPEKWWTLRTDLLNRPSTFAKATVGQAGHLLPHRGRRTG